MRLKVFALKCDAEVLAVFEKVDGAPVHVDQHANDAALLELFRLMSALVRVFSFFPVVASFFLFFVNVVVLAPFLAS